MCICLKLSAQDKGNKPYKLKIFFENDIDKFSSKIRLNSNLSDSLEVKQEIQNVVNTFYENSYFMLKMDKNN